MTCHFYSVQSIAITQKAVIVYDYPISDVHAYLILYLLSQKVLDLS